MADKECILMTMSGGGFLWQSLAVARAIAPSTSIVYVCDEPQDLYARHALPTGGWKRVDATLTFKEGGLVRDGWQTLRLLRACNRILLDVRPRAVIAVATSLALPLALCAKFQCIPFVFIESITRVTKPSMTGRVLSRMGLCDRIYVQWPEAVSLYPRAVYRGSLL